MQSLVVSSRQELVLFPSTVSVGLNNLGSTGVYIFIKGPLGTSQVLVPDTIHVVIDSVVGVVTLTSFTKEDHVLCSTLSQKLRHLIADFEKLYTILVEVRGLGYRMRVLENGSVEFFIGRSHTEVFTPPVGIQLKLLGTKGRVLQLASNDRALLTQVFANIRKFRHPGVYSERGVYMRNEVARCKTGKKKKFG